MDSFIVPANLYDGTTAIKHWCAKHSENELLEKIQLIYADGTFGGTFRRQMKAKYKIEVEIPIIPIAQKGKVEIHEKR